MKKTSFNSLLFALRLCTIIFLLTVISLAFFSFTVKADGDNILTMLGISKPEADKKITNSFIGGYFSTDGAKKARNIVLGQRSAATRDLLLYTKTYVSQPAFKAEYARMRESRKPRIADIKTPAQLRKEMVDSYESSIKEMQEGLKTAGPELKAIFENQLTESRKMLKEAKDPANKTIAAYEKSYPEYLKSARDVLLTELAEWEKQYPADHFVFIKTRLEEFMAQTSDVDFDAELTARGNKKIFTNKVYEGKSSYWKMAFRAGKEVVIPARTFVNEWISEIESKKVK